MSEKYDAIIIGAGIIGACIAFELAKKGWRTVNIDKLPAAGYGPTSNSCGIIRLHYSTYEGVAMAREGFFYWNDWAEYVGNSDERGLARYENTGCLVFKTALNKNLETVCAALDELDVSWEELDVETLKARMPAYALESFAPARRPDDPQFGEGSREPVAGAIFVPDSGYVGDPQLCTHNVQRAAEAKGATFLFNSEIIEIRKAGGKVAGVTLKGGEEIDAAVVVNVAGPHSYLVNRMAGVEEGMKIKTRALRQEVAHVPCPEGMSFDHVTSDGDIGCYCRPETGNNILVGSEDPACDEREWVDPDDYNRDCTDQWEAQVYRFAQRLPTLGIPSQRQGVVDLYDVSDDWIPIYDQSDLPGFYMAIGTSGNQFKNAPVAGAMMADLIERCQAGHDHDGDPLQFHLRHIGRTVNVGFYSRLRETNPDSSYSVIG